MMAAQCASKIVRTLRLDEERLQTLLDQLDAAGSATTTLASNAGQKDPFSYRAKINMYILSATGDAGTAYAVQTQGISNRSIVFLFGRFLYENTRIRLQVTTRHGTWNDVYARVQDCGYIEANVYAITAQFEQPIDAALYSSRAVSSRVLLVEDDQSLARLAMHRLKEFNATVDCVSNGEQAVTKALAGVYDVVLLDMEMPILDGFEAVRRLRNSGYVGYVVAVTGLTQPEDKSRCLDAGCDHYFPKPYTREDLLDLIRPLQEEPIFSTYSNDPGMTKVIQSFTSEVPAKLREIRKALLEEDFQEIARLARMLKSEGTAYGFELLSNAAARVETACLSTPTTEALRCAVNFLARLALQIRPPTAAAGAYPPSPASPPGSAR